MSGIPRLLGATFAFVIGDIILLFTWLLTSIFDIQIDFIFYPIVGIVMIVVSTIATTILAKKIKERDGVGNLIAAIVLFFALCLFFVQVYFIFGECIYDTFS